MATEMLPTTDTSRAHPSASSSTGFVDTDAEVGRKVPWSMWRPNLSLPRSQVVGADPTAVSQNGTSVSQNTAGIISSLAPSPGRILMTPPPLERFSILAKWIGRVQRVDEDSFVALVQDQLEDHPEEEVEFPTSDVAEVDGPLLMPGAIFYWSIGYRDRHGGPRRRESTIRFRRLPRPSQTEIADADEWARSIQALVDHESVVDHGSE